MQTPEKTIQVVKQWLEDPFSLTSEELKLNAELAMATYDAVKGLPDITVASSTRAASAAYASSGDYAAHRYASATRNANVALANVQTFEENNNAR